ncbi:sulfatase [Candidatus Altiarchaeota archaeon]
MILRTRYILPVVLLLALLLLFSPPSLIDGGEKKNARPPNIILITIDALRADHLGCYGYPKNTSPNIDDLAEDSILFENAFSQSSHTTPSYASLLTSSYSSLHRLFSHDETINERFITLPEILKANGYHTIGLFHGVRFKDEVGFSDDFDEFIHLDYILPEGIRSDPENKNVLSPELNERIINWIKENRTEPFFLMTRYYDPHFPYSPPKEYRGLFLEGDEEVFEINGTLIIDVNKGLRLSSEQNKYLVSQYDSSIRYNDHYIGELINTIDELGLGENTIIILTADHGEEFNEHNRLSHGANLYDESIHVPLIIRFPEKFNARYKTQAELIDLMPTILEILGITDIGGLQAQMQGETLLKKEDSGFAEVYQDHIISETGLLNAHVPRKITVRDKTHKYILSKIKKGELEELYDLVNDPEEIRNICLEEEGKCRQLRSIYMSSIMNSSIRDKYRPKKIDYKAQEEEENIKELRSLGYVV